MSNNICTPMYLLIASKQNKRRAELYTLTLNRGHLDLASTPMNISGALNSCRNKATSYKQK